jgi:hypothetical protein
MTDYTLKELMALDNEGLKKIAKQVFSMQFDPFSELGQRAMKKRLAEAGASDTKRISPSVSKIIGMPSGIIENILNYQDARQARKQSTTA